MRWRTSRTWPGGSRRWCCSGRSWTRTTGGPRPILMRGPPGEPRIPRSPAGPPPAPLVRSQPSTTLHHLRGPAMHAALLALAVAASPVVAADAAKKPNVIVLLADDVGWGEFG